MRCVERFTRPTDDSRDSLAGRCAQQEYQCGRCIEDDYRRSRSSRTTSAGLGRTDAGTLPFSRCIISAVVG